MSHKCKTAADLDHFYRDTMKPQHAPSNKHLLTQASCNMSLYISIMTDHLSMRLGGKDVFYRQFIGWHTLLLRCYRTLCQSPTIKHICARRWSPMSAYDCLRCCRSFVMSKFLRFLYVSISGTLTVCIHSTGSMNSCSTFHLTNGIVRHKTDDRCSNHFWQRPTKTEATSTSSCHMIN